MNKVYHGLGRGVTLGLVVLWSLFPVYWAAKTSLTTVKSAEGRPPTYLPTPFTSVAYKDLLGVHGAATAVGGASGGIGTLFARSMINSTIESGGATVLCIAIAICGAYVFARMKLRFKRVIFTSVVGTLLLPIYATLLPLYKMLSSWGLVNTYVGVILVYTASSCPWRSGSCTPISGSSRPRWKRRPQWMGQRRGKL